MIVVVIPACFEHERLPPYARALNASLAEEDLQDCVRIVVSDDGSSHESHEELVSSLSSLTSTVSGWSILYDGTNRGKGGAIRVAWEKHLDAKCLAFLDADGAIPAHEVVTILRQILECPSRGYMGSRVKMLAKKVYRGSTRHFAGRIFATATAPRSRQSAMKVSVVSKWCREKRTRKSQTSWRLTGLRSTLNSLRRFV